MFARILSNFNPFFVFGVSEDLEHKYIFFTVSLPNMKMEKRIIIIIIIDEFTKIFYCLKISGSKKGEEKVRITTTIWIFYMAILYELKCTL